MLTTADWVATGVPLCLLGDSGTGKSHLLIGAGTAAAEAGYRVRYVLASRLVNELAEAADYGAAEAALDTALGWDELTEVDDPADLNYATVPERLAAGTVDPWAGIEQLQAGIAPRADFVARPRWPLDDRAPAQLGSGKKGAKA